MILNFTLKLVHNVHITRFTCAFKSLYGITGRWMDLKHGNVDLHLQHRKYSETNDIGFVIKDDVMKKDKLGKCDTSFDIETLEHLNRKTAGATGVSYEFSKDDVVGKFHDVLDNQEEPEFPEFPKSQMFSEVQNLPKNHETFETQQSLETGIQEGFSGIQEEFPMTVETSDVHQFTKIEEIDETSEFHESTKIQESIGIQKFSEIKETLEFQQFQESEEIIESPEIQDISETQDIPEIQESETMKELELEDHGEFDEAEVTWFFTVKELCDKVDLSGEEFDKMYLQSPQLKQVETVQHLSKIADVLNDFGYGYGVKQLLTRSSNLFCMTSVEQLTSVLEDHIGTLFKMVREHSAVLQSVTPNLETKKAVTKTMMENECVPSVKAGKTWELFPIEKLTEKIIPCKDIVDLLLVGTDIDFRAAFTIWSRDTDNSLLKLYRVKVELLQKHGVTNMDILENLQVIKKLSLEKLTTAIENQKSNSKMVSVFEIGNEYFPQFHKTKMTFTLTSLLKCSVSDIRVRTRRYFWDKSKLDVAAVFYMLTDEGFQRNEISQHIFLLGCAKSDVEKYLRDNLLLTEELRKNSKDDKLSRKQKAEFSRKQKVEMSLQSEKGRKKFLQKMEIALKAIPGKRLKRS